MELPIYRFVVPEDDDEIGVDAIALVDYPAIEMNWQAFKSQFVIEPKAGESQDEFIGRCIPFEVSNGYEQDQAAAMCYANWDKKELAQIGKQKLSLKFTADVEKRIISGPLMVAELPIYRRDDSGEYYGIFTATDIFNIVKKFFRNNNTAQVNMMHDSNLMLKGVYMIESFLIDKNRGIYSPAGYNLTEGSWFGSFKVDNEEVWDDYVKTGKFKGFSVEGMFKTVKIDDKPKSAMEQIIEVVKNIDASKVEMAREILKKANI